jgi:cyanophycinase
MMHTFLSLVRAGSGAVVIIPFASGHPEEQGNALREELRALGANGADVLVGTDVAAAQVAENAGGIFFTGGDQNVLVNRLAGTPLLAAIHEAWRHGAVIGGTSAGAAVMSRVMLTGREYGRPEAEGPEEGDAADAFVSVSAHTVETAEGFGFLDTCIVDQHFVRRKRFNRLASVVLEHPDLIGVGIDESTAIIVDTGGFDVTGEGSVVVLDARHRVENGVASSGALYCRGMNMHILTAGHRFDLARAAEDYTGRTP